MNKKRTEPDENVTHFNNSITLYAGVALETQHWRQWGALLRELISTRKTASNFVAKQPVIAYNQQI